MKNTSTIARLKASPVVVAGLAVFVGSVIAMIAVAALMRGYVSSDQRHLQLVSELRAQAYQLTLLSREATQGSDQAFTDFEKVVNGMTNTWNQLKNTDSGASLAEPLRAYEAVWNKVLGNSQTISGNRALIVSLNAVGQELGANLPTLQTEHDNIVEVLLELKAPAEQAIQAQLLSWRAERIGRNVDKMLRGDEDATAAADQFNRDANFYSRVLTAMKDGDPILGITRVNDESARASLEQITSLFEGVNASIQEMYNGSETLLKARQASVQLLIDSPKLLQALVSIQDRINGLSSERNLDKILLALTALAMAAFFAVGAILYRDARRRADNIAATSQRHQMAIKRLLDDMSDLATGDLTTHANVDEEFTGSIADAVNYAIDQLRILVARINETAVDVSGAAKQTQQTALHLAEAAEHQAQEIVGASAAVNEMAITIDQVSTNAAESAAVAQRAVSIANNGAKVVQNTIHGMDTIREQIQDTSKRIKRLGESSQEIGDIVSLINDIADQTNILALNAAIQASMAGDAGRGFAVVADEVQRLAERSAAATKQIEALVKAIQNDTNQAVTSMEQTTSEVVRGARLAQDAGVALGEIENVSDNLAALIQNISNAARQQAASAGHISNTMNVIQEITMQTASGTSATASSIGELTALALSLRDSVEGFKLPDDMAPHAQAMDYLDALAPAPEAFTSRRSHDEEQLTLS